MKKIIPFLLVLAAVISFFPPNTASATGAAEQKEIIFLEDGAYIEVTLESVSTIGYGVVTKSKNYTYYGADKVAEWNISLTGTFAYNGINSSCTLSSCSVDIYDSAWYVVSKTPSLSGNTAYATVTMGYKVLGVTVSKKTYDITLTCDKDGNLS